MGVKFSPQVAALWPVGVVTLVWSLWYERNSCTREGARSSSFVILARILVACREANSFYKLGTMHNQVSDLFILRSLRVDGRAATPKTVIYVTWGLPGEGWIKANTDGFMIGRPGVLHAWGVFCNKESVVLGCFHVSSGVGFAFEAELLGIITAIEMAHQKNWVKLWIESDSTYVVGLLNARSRAIPWRWAVGQSYGAFGSN